MIAYTREANNVTCIDFIYRYPLYYVLWIKDVPLSANVIINSLKFAYFLPLRTTVKYALINCSKRRIRQTPFHQTYIHLRAIHKRECVRTICTINYFQSITFWGRFMWVNISPKPIQYTALVYNDTQSHNCV